TDVSSAEYREVDIILCVGNDVVDVRTRNLERFEYFEFSGFFIEPKDRVGSGILQPYFAIDLVMFRTDLIDLNMVSIQLWRKAPCLEFLSFLIEFRYAALKLHAKPYVFVLIKPYSKAAGRHFGFQQRDRVFGDLACFWIKLSQNLLTETRVPRH